MSAPCSAFRQPAMIADHNRAQRMPFSTHAMCMPATPNILFFETGVLASVSLFVLLHIDYTLLLISLVLLISLILIGLTGLSGLVGLSVRLEPHAAQGD